MKNLFVSLLMLCIFAGAVWGEAYIIDGATVSNREVIVGDYDAIVLRNSKFEQAVVIANMENLKILMIMNCDFEDLVSVTNNPVLDSATIASGNFKKHLLVTHNVIEKNAIFSDNYIEGYFQLSENQIGGRAVITISKAERGFSCFGNIFSSILQINATDFGQRSVLYGNRFSEFQLNDSNFGVLTIQDNQLETSLGFVDCTMSGHLAIRQLSDIGDPNGKRSVNFHNTIVYGSVFIENIDSNVLMYNLWQLDFFQDLFIDYNRLINSIALITDRIVHSPQLIETVFINNPYKELNRENIQIFNQMFSRLKSGFDKRGERSVKINFAKWEYHYKNSFNAPFIKILKTITFFASFELFLNIYIPLFISIIICVVFVFIYTMRGKTERYKFKYLKVDREKCVERYLIAFVVSTSVFCNLPLAAKKMREEEVRNIAWIEGMLGMIMLLIIAAIIGRIATI